MTVALSKSCRWVCIRTSIPLSVPGYDLHKCIGILADGSKIAFKRVAGVMFKIGDHEYRHEFVLADISHHMLLGLDLH